VVNLSDREISAEIIELCRRGDRDAFRSPYEAYKERVYSIALCFFHGDQAAAGDATQQVFLRLMNSMGKFRGGSDFRTRLYRLVLNVCLDDARRHSSRREDPEARLANLAVAASRDQVLPQTEIAGAVTRH